MNLIDFLLPEASQAASLRTIAENTKRAQASAPRSRKTRELEMDMNSVALVCMALVASLIEKGVISEQDLQKHLIAVDGLDGSQNDGLDVGVLRNALGMETTPPKPKLPGKTPPRKKR